MCCTSAPHNQHQQDGIRVHLEGRCVLLRKPFLMLKIVNELFGKKTTLANSFQMASLEYKT
jgi:hypothetical protein